MGCFDRLLGTLRALGVHDNSLSLRSLPGLAYLYPIWLYAIPTFEVIIGATPISVQWALAATGPVPSIALILLACQNCGFGRVLPGKFVQSSGWQLRLIHVYMCIVRIAMRHSTFCKN